MTQPPDPILSYAGTSAHISRLAKLALVAAIVGALTFFLVLPSMLAFILAIVADIRIKKHPDKLAGRGYTTAAITLNICVLCISTLFFVLTPSIGKPHELANRSACAANLRGIMSAMIIYSGENSDQFPVVTFAPYTPALNSPTAIATSTSADDSINSYFKAPFPQAGSVTASLWINVLKGMSPKLFICKSDINVGSRAELLDPDKKFFNSFQSDQISYSAAYPWKSDGTVGKWWSNTADASLPLLADMAPENGTGSPRRNVTPAATPPNNKSWNSGNHNGDGQNVAYGDVHVDYVKRPDFGQDHDNIYTTSATPSIAPTQFGGLPATKSSPTLTQTAPPFDIIMFPIRNLDTGRL